MNGVVNNQLAALFLAGRLQHVEPAGYSSSNTMTVWVDSTSSIA
jgi:hypothetical protein